MCCNNVVEGILFGMGNPLLDISAAADGDFLEKYGLKADNAILAEDKHKNIFQDMISQYKVDYIPGGATQNAIKVAQWILGQPKATTFMGCIGNDEFGKIMRDKVEAIGVNARYQVHPTKPTGSCAVLITGPKRDFRSLCANLAAADCFTESHLDETHNWELIHKAKYYYIAGFFLTVCPPAALRVAKEAVSHKDGLFSLNLAAPFIPAVFKEPLQQLLPFVDILFGDVQELKSLAQSLDFQTEDINEMAKKAATLPMERPGRQRLVVITQGPDPVIVCQGGSVKLYSVPAVPIEEVVDTNGAGDAFVGGFLAQLICRGGQLGADDVNAAVSYGIRCAHVVIKRDGCTLPDSAAPPF